MTSSEIRYQISICNTNIQNATSEIVAIEKDEDECEHLKNKFSNLLASFLEKQNVRKIKLAEVLQVKDIKSVNSYYSGMFELLKGNEFINVCTGLDDAISKIQRKIVELEMQRNQKLIYKSNQINRRTELEALLDIVIREEAVTLENT